MWGGDEGCEHAWGEDIIAKTNDSNRGTMEWTTGGDVAAKVLGTKPSQGAFCRHCHAWRGSLGLEPMPELYIAHMVEVFREVKRVLRRDGTCWVNMGDSYASIGRSGRKESPGVGAKQAIAPIPRTLKWKAGGGSNFSWGIPCFGSELKPKDLCGMPWRLAFALQSDGWWLRSEIIWAKPSPMPESVRDRPTKSHETIFLLTKAKTYYYDAIAVAEPTVDADAISEHNGGQLSLEVADETMHEMRTDEDRGELPQGEKGEERAEFALPSLSRGVCESLCADGAREAIETGSLHAVQDERAWESETADLQSLREDGRCAREMAKDRSRASRGQEIQRLPQTESCAAAILREREREGGNRSIPANAQGSRELAEGSPQTTGSDEPDHLRSDGSAMADNQGSPTGTMCDMWQGVQADKRSHRPSEQGRPAHGDQHSGVVPKLQQQKGRPLGRTRNRRTVWTIPSKGFPGSHFATFPPKLIEPMILTSPTKCCVVCGRGWERVTETTGGSIGKGWTDHNADIEQGMSQVPMRVGDMRDANGKPYTVTTLGFRPGCDCPGLDGDGLWIDLAAHPDGEANWPTVPAVVLDPFSGASTTIMVALRHERNAIGLELSEAYVEMSRKRILDDNPMFNGIPSPQQHDT